MLSFPQSCSNSPSYDNFRKVMQSSPAPHSPQHTRPAPLTTPSWTAQPGALLTSQTRLDFASVFSLVSRHFFQLLLLQTISCTLAKITIITDTYTHVISCLKIFNSPPYLQTYGQSFHSSAVLQPNRFPAIRLAHS